MLIAVTIFAVWLGWEGRVVRNRYALRRQIEESGGQLVSTTDYNNFAISGESTTHISFWRRWLGDEAVEGVILGSEATQQNVTDARSAFPESKIWKYTADRGDFLPLPD